MTALVLENFGDDKFARTELPVPPPQAGEVLERVHASGVNPIDFKIRLGEALLMP
jgi:NADPH:quinone reductase-like Zn-dependent oxidoreductase